MCKLSLTMLTAVLIIDVKLQYFSRNLRGMFNVRTSCARLCYYQQKTERKKVISDAPPHLPLLSFY